MIVIDSSAIIAILLDEPERQAFEDIIASAEKCVMSALNGHETACVVRSRLGAAAVDRFWRMLTDSEIDIVAFDDVQMRASAVAFGRYGKGIDPKARLNLADCAAYALAQSLNAPLLFKGHDFTATDVLAAV
jgi:ribonuclease VapC